MHLYVIYNVIAQKQKKKLYLKKKKKAKQSTLQYFFILYLFWYFIRRICSVSHSEFIECSSSESWRVEPSQSISEMSILSLNIFLISRRISKKKNFEDGPERCLRNQQKEILGGSYQDLNPFDTDHSPNSLSSSHYIINLMTFFQSWF